jgi:molybdopterin-guanine dinucleotide biosynthesis protein A
MKTAIILAGGRSERFGQDKGTVLLAGKPLVSHVFERAHRVAEEAIIVVGSTKQKEDYLPLFPKGTKISVDLKDSQSPLVGALTGFTNARGEYSILLPCDTPFVSTEIMELLFDIAPGMDAVIPKWPNDYIEPLQAVYRTDSALAAARSALEKGEARIRSMISLLRVRYVSTMVIEQLDPHLTTFFNINTQMDLKKAEALIKKKMPS